MTLEWKDLGKLQGNSDIELDPGEYAECIVDMWGLEKKGLQMREVCGQKYSIRHE